MRNTIIGIATLLLATTATAQQLNLPRVSPKGSVMQTVGTTDITITYNRPGVKGRTIWGGLVPYDQVWRTGANEATQFVVSDDVLVNGQKLAKGSYSLHTIPGRDQWTVIFNKTANQWGSYSYDAAQDALRVTAKPERAEFREWMMFEIPEMTTDTAKVVFRWENVAVPFTVDTQATQKSLEAAEKAIAAMNSNRWLTPYRAADFAFSSNRMTEAQKWLDMSLKEQETTANLWLKARMLNAQGRKADALRTAEQAIAKAGPDQQDFASEIRRLSGLWK
jgi:ribosomal protein S4